MIAPGYATCPRSRFRVINPQIHRSLWRLQQPIRRLLLLAHPCDLELPGVDLLPHQGEANSLPLRVAPGRTDEHVDVGHGRQAYLAIQIDATSFLVPPKAQLSGLQRIMGRASPETTRCYVHRDYHELAAEHRRIERLRDNPHVRREEHRRAVVAGERRGAARVLGIRRCDCPVLLGRDRVGLGEGQLVPDRACQSLAHFIRSSFFALSRGR